MFSESTTTRKTEMNFEIPIFKMSHEQSLVTRIAENKDRYTRKTSWAAGDPSKTCILSGIMAPKNLATLIDPDLTDVENATALHKALSLTPYEASNPMLWSRLTHVEFWPYMRERWDATGKPPTFIETRYFVRQMNSRHLTRNGLARLWWAAHLTCQNRQYQNTEILLRVPEIAERSYARSPLILQTILQFVAENEKKIFGEDKRDVFRTLLRRFNELGGTTLLVELDKSEIEAFLEKSLQEIMKKKSVI